MKEKYMLIALKEAKKAYSHGDVPVGAVLVLNNKIIAKGYNQKEAKHNGTSHAEIITIAKACKKLNTWHLDDCELYVTMEPCLMCAGAIIQARIKKVYYATKNTKFGYVQSIDNVFSNSDNNHIVETSCGLCESQSK